MKSMTGFGYAEAEEDGVLLSVEVKSLNGRYLDLTVSLPASLTALEGRIRDRIQDAFVRGRLEVTVRMKDIHEPLSVVVDPSAAAEWKNALEQLAAILGNGEKVSLDMLTRQEGVFRTENRRDWEECWTALDSLLILAIGEAESHRCREGRDLARDIASNLALMEQSLSAIAGRAPEIRREVEESLRTRFREVLGDDAGEQRVLTETAAWIARMDVNEEIIRLETHIAAFREESAAEGTKGKKLDFLTQEMGREINTIGSKVPRADVARQVVEMKDALEKIREQLRNVE